MHLQIPSTRSENESHKFNQLKYMDTVSVMCLLNDFFAPAFLDF